MAQFKTNMIVGKRESVVDEILLLNPHQTPMLNAVGFGAPVVQTTHYWLEDEMYGYQSVVNGAVDEAATDIVVADIEPFRVEQVVQVGDELMKVTDVNTGTNTITVIRGYADTEAAAIEDGATIEVLFVEGVEGADARAARHKPRVKVENITQIFDDTISISGSAEATSQYAISDLYNYEKAKKQLELALQLEKAVINGIKYENGDVRQMQGMRQFIKTNVDDAGGAALDASIINNLAREIYEKGGFQGGSRHAIIVPAKQKQALSALDQDKIRLDRAENVRGQVVEWFVSDFGRFEIILNNNLRPDELFLVDLNRVAIRPLQTREFFHEFLGRVGDRTEGQIIGEYTLEFKQEKAHGRVTGLA